MHQLDSIKFRTRVAPEPYVRTYFSIQSSVSSISNKHAREYHAVWLRFIARVMHGTVSPLFSRGSEIEFPVTVCLLSRTYDSYVRFRLALPTNKTRIPRTSVSVLTFAYDIYAYYVGRREVSILVNTCGEGEMILEVVDLVMSWRKARMIR